MKKKDIKQLQAIQTNELKNIKGGRVYYPANYFVERIANTRVWEEVDIRFDGGDTSGGSKNRGSKTRNKGFKSSRK